MKLILFLKGKKIKSAINLKRKSVKRTNSLFPGINKKKGRIVLNDFAFLQGYLKKMVSNGKKKKMKRRKSSEVAKFDLPKHSLRQTKSVIIREKRVRYGFDKYDNPNTKTVINKEEIKELNGKKIKEIQFKTVKRNEVEASNKLPLVSQDKRKNRLSNTIKYIKYKVLDYLLLLLKIQNNYQKRDQKKIQKKNY